MSRRRLSGRLSRGSLSHGSLSRRRLSRLRLSRLRLSRLRLSRRRLSRRHLRLSGRLSRGSLSHRSLSRRRSRDRRRGGELGNKKGRSGTPITMGDLTIQRLSCVSLQVANHIGETPIIQRHHSDERREVARRLGVDCLTQRYVGLRQLKESASH